MLYRSTIFATTALAVGLAVAPIGASALDYKVGTPTNYIDYRVDVVRDATPDNVQGGPFTLTGGGESFLAWCFDLDGEVSFGQEYDYTETDFLTSDQRDRVQSVFDANYEDVAGSDGQGPISTLDGQGFQLALWDVIYDDDFNITDTTGSFYATAPTNILNQAQIYLTAAVGDGDGREWTITELKADEKVQDLGTATVIPLPAAAWLLMFASGGLVAAKRRQSKRAA